MKKSVQFCNTFVNINECCLLLYCTHTGAQAVVYLSPSVEYCAHPRYTSTQSRGNHFLQVLLQVRVNPALLYEKLPGTLPGALPSQKKADPHFKNRELEWLVRSDRNAYITPLDGIVPYGLMLRITDEHPEKLPQNRWWKHWRNYDRD